MIQTTLCYIQRGNDYLMLHRVKKKNDLNHDKWIGIGGKFERGESPEECLLREALEETGLTLIRYRYRGIVTFLQSRDAEAEYMHLFTADGFTGAMKTCDEGDLEWISKDRLMELTLWEGDKIFLRLLDENAPFFSLKLTYDGDTLVDAALNGQPWQGRCPREKEPLLISGCLCGLHCRYDGKLQQLPDLERLQERYTLVPACAEQLGGLPTPRIPAECRGDRVVNREGADVTAAFTQGAREVLHLAQVTGCKKALLKERSPSCGHGIIYDGSFTGRKIPGDGCTAGLLQENGLTLYGESQWEELL